MHKIFGSVKIDRRWLSRNNQELRKYYRKHSISNRTRARRLGRSGHILKMPNERLTLEEGGEEGGGEDGDRGRERWQIELENEVEKVNNYNWKKKAANKEGVEEDNKSILEYGRYRMIQIYHIRLRNVSQFYHYNGGLLARIQKDNIYFTL